MIARSLRATNPDNYDKKDKAKPGTKQWEFSVNCLVLKAELRALQSTLAEARKCANNRLANDILSLGTNISIEEDARMLKDRLSKNFKLAYDDSLATNVARFSRG